jgi:hypothetical protein
VGLYDFLVTWPPPSLPGGFAIPGWLRRDDAVTPPDVWDRIPLDPFVNSYDRAFTSQHYLRLAQREVREKAPRWNQLVRAFDIEVGAVTFYALDMTAHRFWHGAFPEDFEAEVNPTVPGEKSALRDAARGVDRSIGEIAATLAPEDTLIAVSDHGFRANPDGGKSVWVTDVEAVLSGAGLEAERDGFTPNGFGVVTMRVHPGPIQERDAVLAQLLALLESMRSPEGERLFGTIEAVDLAERPPEARRSLATRIRQWVVRQIVRYVFDVTLDDKQHAVVFALPDDEVLEPLWPDGRIRIGERSLPLSQAISRQRFTGDHDPIGVFLAAGGPIAQRSERGDLSVLDLAPLIFYLAGRPVPDDLEGRLPEELFAEEHLAAHPPRSAEPAELPGLGPEEGGSPVVEDPELVEKLRALGYLE